MTTSSLRTILAVLALALAAPAAALAQSVVVSGQVVDAATTRAVAGALVRAHPSGRATRTDAEGRFSLAIPRGIQMVAVSMIGYRGDSQVVEGETDTSLGTIALTPAPVPVAAVEARAARNARYSVRGTVVDAATGEPLAAARVEVTRQRVDRGEATDAGGAFLVERLPPGSYMVRYEMLGYRPAIQLLTLESDTTLGQVALEPDAIMLEALKVTADRFERRRRSFGGSARLPEREQIAYSAARNVAQLIQERTGITPAPCHSLLSPMGTRSTGFGGSGCIRVRGAATQPAIYIDEIPSLGGLDELALYRPYDIARIEIYRGGAMIRVYTTWFMESAARRKYRPMPLIL